MHAVSSQGHSRIQPYTHAAPCRAFPHTAWPRLKQPASFRGGPHPLPPQGRLESACVKHRFATKHTWMGCSRSARWSASCVRVAFSITSLRPLHTPCEQGFENRRNSVSAGWRVVSAATPHGGRTGCWARPRAHVWCSACTPTADLAGRGRGAGHALPQNGDDLAQDAVAHLAHLRTNKQQRNEGGSRASDVRWTAYERCFANRAFFIGWPQQRPALALP